MKDDVVMKMLRQVASGEVSVEDAREALDGISLTEEAYETAIEHGVFNEAPAGSIAVSYTHLTLPTNREV